MKKTAHILKSFEPGGVEKWLVDITKINKNSEKKIDFHFLLQSSNPGFFASEIKSNGGKIHSIIYSKYNFFIYLIKLFIHFKKNKYDVVHSHVYHFSGFILLIAFFAGIPVRIAHCHNEKKDKKKSTLKNLYTLTCQKLIDLFATKKIAVSNNSAQLFYKKFSDVLIIPCGVLFENINANLNSEPDINIRLLSVASFTYQKNHDFMLEIANQLKIENIKFKFNWIGAGNLTTEITNKIKKYKLEDNIIVLGKRNDVHNIMANHSDILVFPSHYEGLGLAAIESQYYGLTTLINESLPIELDNSNYIFRIPILNEDISQWVSLIKNNQKASQEDISNARKKISNSPLNAYNNFNKLLKIYSE
ncbi:glycosyltransferase [Providencia sp. PROV039]|uniref:glycosyltransferase n=1 Tax=Providencia sp. PROV039 TaxID=2949770 RepID=UPI0023490EB5|nr:glycosyltransferase [Providencia sp. PROV039]